MAKFLVTGGAGFIGSRLAKRLEADGHHVVVVDSFRTAGKTSLPHFCGEILTYDLSTPGPLPLPNEKFDAVFHHGDITDPRHGDEREVFERNLACFRNIADWAAKQAGRLVYASSAGVYGNSALPMREHTSESPITSYGRSKLAIDALAAKDERIPMVGLRYFNVFGPGEAHKGRAASMAYHLYLQMRIGQRPRLFEFGEQRRDFVYVDDTVEACMKALTAPRGVYNVGTGVGSTFIDLVGALNRALGTNLDPEFFPMPYDPQTYQHHTEASTEHAKIHLGFVAQWPLQEAINDYVRFLEQESKKESK